MYVCMHVCMYVCMYVYIYIYIHTHIVLRKPSGDLLRRTYVAYVSVPSQISNCQGLGRENKHETLKADRIIRIAIITTINRIAMITTFYRIAIE